MPITAQRGPQLPDLVKHLLVAFVVGVTDIYYEIVESGDASTIFRWTIISSSPATEPATAYGD